MQAEQVEHSFMLLVSYIPGLICKYTPEQQSSDSELPLQPAQVAP